MSDTPDTIAKSLYEVLVEEGAEDDTPQTFRIPEMLITVFRAKVRLYREAIILMVLISESESQAKFKEVLFAYEKLMFDAVPSPKSLQKLGALKRAMSDVNGFISQRKQRKELTWGRQWLHELGHDEYNPATLSLFAIHWINEIACVEKSIKDVEFML